MAERNPNIPSEQRQEMEERTRIDEDDANHQFAEKQAKMQREAGALGGETSDEGTHDNDE